jgi:hypothetical protein
MDTKIRKKQSGLGKETKEGGFKEAYHSLQHKMLLQARDEICKLCYWNVATFRVKLKGGAPFRVYEIQQIEKFFEQYNMNAWTGESLKKK